MAVWAIADLHLSFGVPNKGMEVFGSQWEGWTQKVESHWRDLIKEDDLVLIAGDISWAISPEKASPDLEWIGALPGTKVIIRGNHDYWWTSLSKVEKILPPSLHLIQNNAYTWKDFTIGGTRLWDTEEFSFGSYIDYIKNPKGNALLDKDEDKEQNEKIFQRELCRLELSLKELNPKANYRIAMTHYPPLGGDLQSSQASALLEKYRINTCVFGHLHNVKQQVPLFGEKNGVHYYLTSCDYLNFKPIRIY